LAAGKGVYLPEGFEEAKDCLKQILVDHQFGDSGKEVVIEERLYGEEASILVFSDGYTAVPLPAVQDHKRVFDGDQVILIFIAILVADDEVYIYIYIYI
jgi:phosphoribosylamine--glycine ligase/phosphoribosylformylglycinamidine cyclo-ligase